MQSTSPTGRDRVVGLIRWGFAIYFVAIGTLHFVVPDGLPSLMSWMYELDGTLHAIAGTAEILGGLGLVLPYLVGVAPRLTVAAAGGLAVLMASAAAWHIGRGEWIQILGNLLVAGVMAYVGLHERRSRAPDGSLGPVHGGHLNLTGA